MVGEILARIDPALVDDHVYPADVLYVFQRIRVQEQEIRQFVLFHRPQLVFNADHPSAVAGGGHQGLHGTQPRLREELDFPGGVVALKIVAHRPASVRASRKQNASLMRLQDVLPKNRELLLDPLVNRHPGHFLKPPGLFGPVVRIPHVFQQEAGDAGAQDAVLQVGGRVIVAQKGLPKALGRH